MPQLYDADFYAAQSAGSLTSARIVAPLLLRSLPVRSVLDVGCGVGTWLQAFREAGVDDVFGVDGHQVDAALLKIPPARFRTHDLTSPLDLGRRFDLVVSLEVAEHLPRASSERFLESLVRHSDLVLFSAATPGQGGTGHVNEQWQGYWAAKFARRGYLAFDAVRPQVWRDRRVKWWYRQNCVLYVRRAKAAALSDVLGPPAGRLDAVHPAQIGAALTSPRRLLKLARPGVLRRVRIRRPYFANSTAS